MSWYNITYRFIHWVLILHYMKSRLRRPRPKIIHLMARPRPRVRRRGPLRRVARARERGEVVRLQVRVQGAVGALADEAKGRPVQGLAASRRRRLLVVLGRGVLVLVVIVSSLAQLAQAPRCCERAQGRYAGAENGDVDFDDGPKVDLRVVVSKRDLYYCCCCCCCGEASNGMYMPKCRPGRDPWTACRRRCSAVEHRKRSWPRRRRQR